MSTAEQATFADEADKYELRHTAGGALVYVERPYYRGGPYFCAHCFCNKRLSVLQPAGRDIWQHCNACDNEFRTRDDGPVPVDDWPNYFIRRYAKVRPFIIMIRVTMRKMLWFQAMVAEAKAAILASFSVGIFRLHRRLRAQTCLFGRYAAWCRAESRRCILVTRCMRNGLRDLNATHLCMMIEPKWDADDVHS